MTDDTGATGDGFEALVRDKEFVMWLRHFRRRFGRLWLAVLKAEILLVGTAGYSPDE